MNYLSKSLNETAKIGKDFLSQISKTKRKSATVVGLFGNLGSGKTTFVQILGRDLDIKEVMTSPTFVLEKIYKLDGKFGFDSLIHIDAYRLEKGKELSILGFNEQINNPKNLIVIEWPEKVGDVLPDSLTKIDFKFVSENEREISF